MRSNPDARTDSLSPREIVTTGLVVIGFVVCTVAVAKVAYSVVTLFLHGVTIAMVSLY